MLNDRRRTPDEALVDVMTNADATNAGAGYGGHHAGDDPHPLAGSGSAMLPHAARCPRPIVDRLAGKNTINACSGQAARSNLRVFAETELVWPRVPGSRLATLSHPCAWP